MSFFFFTDPATTEIYTLSLHDALPISHGTRDSASDPPSLGAYSRRWVGVYFPDAGQRVRSEEHTSELQSRQYLVCRLLLEKKKQETRTDEQWREELEDGRISESTARRF